MGDNHDLCDMLGMPANLKCPVCQEYIKTDFDDYDLEAGQPFKAGGYFFLTFYCHNCDIAFRYEGQIAFQNVKIVSGHKHS